MNPRYSTLALAVALAGVSEQLVAGAPTSLPTPSPSSYPTVVPSVDLCTPVEYKNYFRSLDFCADPLFWSHYSIPNSVNSDIDYWQRVSKSAYDLVRDGIYLNESLLKATGVDRIQLKDCIGMAQRVSCHMYMPKCRGSTERKVCRGLCEDFHSRCTVDGVIVKNINLIQAGIGQSYPLYECDALTTDAEECSAAPRRTVSTSVGASSLVLALMYLLGVVW